MIWAALAAAALSLAASAAALLLALAGRTKTAPEREHAAVFDGDAEEEMRRFSSGVAHVLGYEAGR